MTTIIKFEDIPMSDLEFSPANPRSDVAEDLEGLAASLGEPKNPMLVNPPVVQKISSMRYQVIAGERRVRAAQLAGWNSISCQVRDLSARACHRLRVAENLHRKEWNPIDLAIALKISWLVANGDALEISQDVEQVLKGVNSQAHILAELEELLERSGFMPTHPPVSWDELLNGLGVEMKPDSRRKLMRVLCVDLMVRESVQHLDLTEAALRSIGGLDVAEQKHLAKELIANPNLVRKVRRISRVVRAGTHTFDEALAEVQGQVALTLEENESVAAEIIPDDERMTGLVIQLLEAATTAQQSVDSLRGLLGDDYLANMPEAWRGYADEALKIVRTI
jgi:ParB/RepB/Spo0J family partition protein